MKGPSIGVDSIFKSTSGNLEATNEQNFINSINKRNQEQLFLKQKD